MAPPRMERKGSFDQLFDNIDADTTDVSTARGRGKSTESSTNRSCSKPRRAKSRSRTSKMVAANDLFGGGSDSDESCKSTKSKNSTRSGKMKRSASTRSNVSKKDKAMTHQNKKVAANDIFGDSLSDLNHSEDESSSHHHNSKKGTGDNNVPWKDADPAFNQKEFEKMVRERTALKKLVEDMKRENAELRKEVRNSDVDNRKLRQSLADGAGNSHKVQTLEEENQRLLLELRETVDRASTMVKQREDATEQLLEELEKLREDTHETRKMFDVTLFKNKNKTEELDHQNDRYAQRIQELEQTLVGASKKK